MLSIFFMLLFSIPFSWLGSGLSQILFFMVSMVFIFHLSSFFHFESVGFLLGIDMMSYMLVLLSIWICALMIVSSNMVFYTNFYGKLFMLNIFFMALFLFLSFSVTNIFLFYLFFESSLIPIFFLIMGWGFQGERLQAGVYMLFYTLMGSLPLLIIMMMIYQDFYNLSMMNFKNLWLGLNWMIYVSFLAGFFIKLPMFLVHFWLPKAHVEAPVAGSMILAGVLLKLGGYGLIRVQPILLSEELKFNFLIVLSLVGGVLISLNCLIQSDMKLLIAYSSVSHMGLMMGGILTASSWGLLFSLTMMLGHGLCSSGLFFLVNTSYERVGSRNLFLVKGMLSLWPKMSLWWFLFCVVNMAAPPSMNLLSEIGLIITLVGWGTWGMILLGLMGFFAAGYSLYLFSFSQHGKNSFMSYNFLTGGVCESLVLMMHFIPLMFLAVNFDLIVLWI